MVELIHEPLQLQEHLCTVARALRRQAFTTKQYREAFYEEEVHARLLRNTTSTINLDWSFYIYSFYVNCEFYKGGSSYLRKVHDCTPQSLADSPHAFRKVEIMAYTLLLDSRRHLVPIVHSRLYLLDETSITEPFCNPIALWVDAGRQARHEFVALMVRAQRSRRLQKKLLALLMATHHRVGASSWLQQLPDGILERIIVPMLLPSSSSSSG